MGASFECPCCGNSLTIEIDSNDDRSQEVECSYCEATLEVSYTISMEVENVDITEVPSADFDCPECDESMTLDSIDEESGSESQECENCKAILEVDWTDWGKDINAQVVGGPEIVLVDDKPEKDESRRHEKYPKEHNSNHDDEDWDEDDEEFEDDENGDYDEEPF